MTLPIDCRFNFINFFQINDLEWLEIIFSAGPPPLEDFPKNVKNVESTKICLFNMLTFVSATI